MGEARIPLYHGNRRLRGSREMTPGDSRAPRMPRVPGRSRFFVPSRIQSRSILLQQQKNLLHPVRRKTTMTELGSFVQYYNIITRDNTPTAV